MDGLAFSDIYLTPQKSDISSRSTDIDLTTDWGKFSTKLPFITANMPAITEHKMARAMNSHGALGILHRFYPIDENCLQWQKVNDGVNLTNDLNPYKAGVSVGVKEESRDRFNALFDAGARLFTIDIAHGHSDSMQGMIEYMRDRSDDVVLIGGNVATYWGAKELYQWGVQIVKVGIGGGSVCRTRTKTGFGVPQFSAVKSIREGFDNDGIEDVRIISDGAIVVEGDLAKALLYADGIMMGGAFAGTTETPGPVYEDHASNLIHKVYYKLFGGSASSEHRGHNRFVEGEMIKVPFKGHVKHVIKGMREALQSSLSYGGAHNIPEFQENMRDQWRVMGSGGKTESKL